MARKKAWFVTAAIMVLLALVIWFISRYSVTAWRILLWVFGVYGFIHFGGDFGKWLIKPEGRK